MRKLTPRTRDAVAKFNLDIFAPAFLRGGWVGGYWGRWLPTRRQRATIPTRASNESFAAAFSSPNRSMGVRDTGNGRSGHTGPVGKRQKPQFSGPAFWLIKTVLRFSRGRGGSRKCATMFVLSFSPIRPVYLSGVWVWWRGLGRGQVDQNFNFWPVLFLCKTWNRFVGATLISSYVSGCKTL